MVRLPALRDGTGGMEPGPGVHVLLSVLCHICVWEHHRGADKRSPRLVVFIGGGIFAVGVLLSAFLVIPSPIPIYITYGLMQGFGQGMIYTTIISTAQKWFPGRTGFASGIVVTANGLCGFFLAPISWKRAERGWPFW